MIINKFSISKTILFKVVKINIQICTMLYARQFIKRNYVFGSFKNNIILKKASQNNVLKFDYLYKSSEIHINLSDKLFNKNNYLNSNSSLQKENIVSKYLLLTADPNKNFNSGLMSLSPQEYLFLKGSDIDSKGYQHVIQILLAKILYILYGMDQKISLWRKFDLIFNDIGLDLSALPKYLSSKKCITMLQHILVYVCHDKQFSYEMLKDFANPINCESYKDQKITILSFIEAYIIKKNLLKNNIDNPFKLYHLINPDNLQAVPGFIPLESVQQAGQLNSDLFVIRINSTLIEKFYADVKTYTTAGFFDRNLLSMSFYNKKDFLKEINNVKITLQALIKSNDISQNALKKLLMNILQLKNDKDCTEKEKAIKLHELLLKFKMRNTNKNILVALNMPLMTSEIFDFENTFFNLLNRITHRIDQQDSNDNLDIMFPSTTQVNEQQRLQFLNDFVNTHFQEEPELRQEILNNINSQLCIENS